MALTHCWKWRRMQLAFGFGALMLLCNLSGRSEALSHDQCLIIKRASKKRQNDQYAGTLAPFSVSLNGFEVEIADSKALEFLLQTLPAEIRKLVRKKTKASKGKPLQLASQSLDDIESLDDNFQALKVLVNHPAITEIRRGSGVNGIDFLEEFNDELRIKDVNDMVATLGISEEEARRKVPRLSSLSSFYYGETICSDAKQKKKQECRLEVIITDQMSKGKGIADDTVVVTLGHELYFHAYQKRVGNYGLVNDPPGSRYCEEILAAANKERTENREAIGKTQPTKDQETKLKEAELKVSAAKHRMENAKRGKALLCSAENRTHLNLVTGTDIWKRLTKAQKKAEYDRIKVLEVECLELN